MTLEGQRTAMLVIITDDHGIGDAGLIGNPAIKKPNLDKLPVNAARMTRSPARPVRTPTRGCLMTGRRNYRTRAAGTRVGRAMASHMRPSDGLRRRGLRPAAAAQGPRIQPLRVG